MLRTQLTERLGLSYPIISAPMVRMSGGDLAGAVSKAGGLGTFGAVSPQAGSVTIEYLADNVARARAATDRPFGIGFITPFIEENRANFDFVLAEEVPIVLLSFGDPRPWLRLLKARGRTVLCQVQTMEAARMAVGEGADVLAVQGSQSGGHCGELNLLPFLDEATDTFPDTPIVAAGGVASGRTLTAVLAAGADGAWIGTGFRAVRECMETTPEERSAILESDGRDTMRNSVYDVIMSRAIGGGTWPAGIAMRTQVNPLVRRWLGREEELAARIAAAPEEYKHVWDDPASKEYGHIFGEAAKYVTEIETAAGFMDRIVSDAERLLSRWSDAPTLPAA